MITEFITAPRIIIGEGAVRKVGEISQGFGHRALVVSGSTQRYLDVVGGELKKIGISYLAYPTKGEPTVDVIKDALKKALEEKIEFIIGMGGGSVLDTGKAVSILANNEGDIYEYLEVIGKGRSFEKPALPYIAIPTTAGTGTEVTKNAVIGSPDHRVKVSLRSTLMIPRVAIIDPELTYDLPPAITASSGMDALTQLVEPYVSNAPNPVTDALCRDGIMRIANSLIQACQNGNNIEARKNMSIASLFSGMALANAKLGAVHGFAGVLGGMYSAPHGQICAALLPHVIQVNIRALQQRDPKNNSLRRYAEIARMVVGEYDAELSSLVDWAFDIQKRLNIPSLSEIGVKEDEFNQIVEKASRASSMKGNPISLTEEELLSILQNAL